MLIPKLRAQGSVRAGDMYDSDSEAETSGTRRKPASFLKLAWRLKADNFHLVNHMFCYFPLAGFKVNLLLLVKVFFSLAGFKVNLSLLDVFPPKA